MSCVFLSPLRTTSNVRLVCTEVKWSCFRGYQKGWKSHQPHLDQTFQFLLKYLEECNGLCDLNIYSLAYSVASTLSLIKIHAKPTIPSFGLDVSSLIFLQWEFIFIDCFDKTIFMFNSLTSVALQFLLKLYLSNNNQWLSNSLNYCFLHGIE